MGKSQTEILLFCPSKSNVGIANKNMIKTYLKALCTVIER